MEVGEEVLSYRHHEINFKLDQPNVWKKRIQTGMNSSFLYPRAYDICSRIVLPRLQPINAQIDARTKHPMEKEF
jgi:hypothetical protein